MNKTEMVTALQDALAILSREEFPGDVDLDFGYNTIRAWCRTPEQFGQAAKALGSFEKDADSSYLNAKRSIGVMTFEATIRRELTCKKIVKGTRVVPATEREVRTETTVVEAQPERVEEIVEWECPESFVALAQEPTKADLDGVATIVEEELKKLETAPLNGDF